MKKISALLFLLIMLGGCASLPETVEISPEKTSDVVSSFKAMIREQGRCPSCIDAQAAVEFKSFFHKGMINGYLQAMAPSFLKFVGVNPLGQPLVVLVTDGEFFHYLSVPEATGYQGDVYGETFRKYAPDGFQPGFTFYRLTGRLWPGVFKIMTVSRDEETQDYWLRLRAGENGAESLILFDPQARVIRQYLLIDQQDEIIMNIYYDNYTAPPCSLPGRIEIKSLVHNSSMQIKLTDRLLDINLGTEEFSCRLPAGFKRIMVP